MESVKANAGKISFVAVVILAAIVIMWLQSGEGQRLPDKLQFICVSTGEVFWLDAKPRIYPAENPKTGQRTLLPCHQNDNGSLSLKRRDRGLIEQLDKEGLNQHVDLKTLVVRKD